MATANEHYVAAEKWLDEVVRMVGDREIEGMGVHELDRINACALIAQVHATLSTRHIVVEQLVVGHDHEHPEEPG